MHLIEQQLDDNGILTITLNRPEKLNALDEEVLDALGEIFTDAATNPKVSALLLTGEGKAFCAGADINKLAHCNAQSGYAFARHGQTIFSLLENMGKPSLAAVNGFAFGGGCELALAATLRLASTLAQFAQPEVKLGVIPGYGGTQRLARLVGKGRALELCLTGRFINADTALQWGLVSEVVQPEALVEKSKNMLAHMLTMSPLALASVMQVIHHGYNLSLDEAMHLEALHFAQICSSEDKIEGVNAFLEKRKAVFKGR